MRLSLWQLGTMLAPLPLHPVEGLELEGKAHGLGGTPPLVMLCPDLFP